MDRQHGYGGVVKTSWYKACTLRAPSAAQCAIGLPALTRSQASPWERGARLQEQSNVRSDFSLRTRSPVPDPRVTPPPLRGQPYCAG
ncbi:MAG: hypothetical protein GDA38_03840 [Hormoscilla sp. SP12CHS1]|nr:hypothetical protein [Hormoscilla sp. SP12CHS1]